MPPVKKPVHVRKRTFLKEWRKFREMSQEQAADRAGVDRTTLGRIENGILPYNQDLMERLAFSYMCEVSELLEVNPYFRDAPTLVFNQLKAAPKDLQARAAAVLEALLKAG